MSEASKRTKEWREQQRDKGYQPVNVWIPASIKNEMVNVSFKRHQDLGELLCELWRTSAPKTAPSAKLLGQREVEALIDAKLAAALATFTAPVPAAPAPPRPPLPAGMKQCGKGHTYPQQKKDCPQCARLRKAAQRTRKAAKRRGQVPA